MATQATLVALQNIAEELKDAGWGDVASRSRLEHANMSRMAKRTLIERALFALMAAMLPSVTAVSLMVSGSSFRWVVSSLTAVVIVIHLLFITGEFFFRHREYRDVLKDRDHR